MNLRRFILDEHGNPVPEPDLMKWAKWFDSQVPLTVARDEVNGCYISTIFLGLNHRYGAGPPILWETMVSGPADHPLHHHQERCSGNREQAEAMHASVVQAVKDSNYENHP